MGKGNPFVQGWYLAVICDFCKKRVLLLRDLNDGKVAINGSFEVTCPECGNGGVYPVEHYYHEPFTFDTSDRLGSRVGIARK